MAWSAPNKSAQAFVLSGDNVLAEPSGMASGDLMVAMLAYRSNAAFTAPSGWTLVAQHSTGNTDASAGIASGGMWWKFYPGSASSHTFTRTAGDICFGRIYAYSGVTASGNTAVDVSASTLLAAISSTITLEPLTTTTDNELIVAFAAHADQGSAMSFVAATDPTGNSGINIDTSAASTLTWFLRQKDSTAQGADGGFGAADCVKATAGSTGIITAIGGGTAATGRHVMIGAAFFPALEGGGGGGTPPDTWHLRQKYQGYHHL